MSVEETEPYYKKRGQELIDLLVDKGFIRDDVSREETRVLEDYIGFLFQSTARSAEQTALLMRKYKDKAES
jgi:hypothetical protein